MPAHIDPDSFGFLITDVSRLIRAEMDRRISEAGLGLSPGDGRTLSYIARVGAVRQNVLAERMGVEAMTLSGYLDRLEALGLVERRADPADRRAKIVHLTDAAGGVLEKIRPIGVGLRADASRNIDPDDWENLQELLKTVRSTLAALRSDHKEGAVA